MHISTIFVLIALSLSSQFLLASAQSTPDNTVDKSPSIENSPCENDWDCINNKINPEMKVSWFNQTTKRRPGDFMCIQKKCKFVVAAGQPCRDETDCIAYHYSIIYNVQFEQKEICSPKYCNFESSCDGAWDQKDLTLPQIEKPSNCCNGLPSESKCDIVANDVDPCDYSSSCNYDKTSGIAKCLLNADRKGSIWIGVLICLLGGVAANIGLNIQKYAFTKHQEESNKITNVNDDIGPTNNLDRSSLYKKLERFMFWKQIIVSPLWVFGLVIYIFGSLLGFVALKFAPQSLVAPLGVVSLVVNLIIAPILHHQTLTVWDIVGVVIIIGGSIVITVYSGIVIQAREDAIALVQEDAAAATTGHVQSSTNANESSLIEVVTEQDSKDKITHNVLDKQNISDKVVHDVEKTNHIPPPRISISSMRTVGSAIRKRNLKEKILLPLAYAILASSLATITTLFAKVPIFYCNWSLFDIIGGGIYYDEFHNFTVEKYIGFIVGICFIFFGVTLLSKRLAMLTKEEELLKERQKVLEQELKKKRNNSRNKSVYDEKKKVKPLN
ncbi:19968_t:CDS:2 [Funneliformis geosporum]|uniref:17204_t:CDS:1 n=1 Tax=Funneliformis geosporum TaxID=1117311 RepID=A0A9W4SIM5_9GLOM|nr:17204_t:CDS:2 [Funneliformis geosporum]CAI2176862.1 19968_t:CDS:2 [Funneliformis geosporum]